MYNVIVLSVHHKFPSYYITAYYCTFRNKHMCSSCEVHTSLASSLSEISVYMYYAGIMRPTYYIYQRVQVY